MIRGLVQQVIKEHRYLLAVVLLLAVVAGVLWIYLLGPQQRQRNELHSAWSDKRRYLQDPETARSLSVYRSNEEALKKFRASVPAQSELPRVLGQVTDSAALHGASIMSMSYKPVPSSINGMLGYNFTVSTKGSYAGLKQLLANLQAMHSLVYVDSISIVNPDPQGNQVVLDVRMVLHLRQEGGTP